MNKLCIIGASGHGKVVADVAAAVGYTDIVFVDDNPDVKQCGTYPVVGTIALLETAITASKTSAFDTFNASVATGANAALEVSATVAGSTAYTGFTRANATAVLDNSSSLDSSLALAAFAKAVEQTDFFVAIGNAKIHQAITERLAGISFATLIHPSAVVSPSASIGCGTVVMPGAVINANAKIGEGCIVNTSASVDHDCVVADFAHISVGAHLAGTVTVGKRTWVGIGGVISNNLTVCEDCTIGAGATVVKSIKEPGTYIGTPAKPKNSQTKNTLRGGRS